MKDGRHLKWLVEQLKIEMDNLDLTIKEVDHFILTPLGIKGDDSVYTKNAMQKLFTDVDKASAEIENLKKCIDMLNNAFGTKNLANDKFKDSIIHRINNIDGHYSKELQRIMFRITCIEKQKQNHAASKEGNRTLESIGLKRRTVNAIHSNDGNIVTAHDLTFYSPTQLREFSGLGMNMVNEILSALGNVGFVYNNENQQWDIIK